MNIQTVFKTVFLFLYLTACNNTKESETVNMEVKSADTSGQAAKQPPGKTLIDTKLDILYMENWAEDGHNQLEKLFGSNPNQIQKLIYQFVYKKPDTLTLILYSGRNGNSSFDKDREVVLSRLKKTLIDLNDYSEVIFGSQESTKKDDNSTIGEFRAAINRPDSKYIIFTPSVESSPIDNRNYIHYKIEGVRSLEEVQLFAVQIGEFNPSPPRKAL